MALADLLEPRLTELGKIKIGGLGAERSKSGGNGTYRLPRKDDFFTITTLNRKPISQTDDKGDLVPDSILMDSLIPRFGDSDKKLRRLPIYVLSNNIEDIMQSAWVYYVGKKCVARSDGVNITWYFRNKQWLEQPITEPHRDEIVQQKNNGYPTFKLHTTFNCVIAAENGRWGGVYKFRTTSRITADQLYGSLIHVAGLTHGQLAGIPLMLVVRPMQVSPDGKPTTVYVCHCEIRGSDMMAIQKQAAQIARVRAQNFAEVRQFESQYRKMLSLPGGESPEEIADISSEFHNDNPAETLALPDSTPTGNLSDLIDEQAVNEEPIEHGDPIEPEQPRQRDVSTWMLFKTAMETHARNTNADPEKFDAMMGWIGLNNPDVKKTTILGTQARQSFYNDFVNGKPIGEFVFAKAEVE